MKADSSQTKLYELIRSGSFCKEKIQPFSAAASGLNNLIGSSSNMDFQATSNSKELTEHQ